MLSFSGPNFFLLISICVSKGGTILGSMTSDPSVVLGIGEVVGKLETFSSDFININRTVAVYHGIPYAEPPVGEMRFKRPAPAIPWEGVYVANEMPPGCPQSVPHHLKHLDATEMTTENCLFLNVFVPIPTPVNASVMVYVHGGELLWGTGLSYPADPLPLAAIGNVILVTMNYRLGLFGFLSTGDEVLPPNLGLHDQRAAFKWVHDNIEAFGGDSEKITIFGNEAGAISVGWHLLSPQSRRFFQRVILQSGNPFSDMTKLISPDEALRRANVTASLVGCSFSELETKHSLRKCLTETHVSDFVMVGSQIGAVLEVQHVWQPVADNDFFPKNVEEILQEGGLDDIDVIIGMNRNEGTYKLFQLTDFSREKPFINKNTFENIGQKLNFEKFEMDILSLLYTEDDFGYHDESDYFDVLSDMITDSQYVCNIKEFASMLQTAGCKVYMYQLTHEPQSQSVLSFSWSSAGYMEDLKYVFGLPFQTDLPFQIPEDERTLSAHFMRLWTNFAKTGDPNISGDPKQPVSHLPEWQEYSKITDNYKKMELKLPDGSHLQTRQCYTWKHVLPDIRDAMVELEKLRSLLSDSQISASDGQNASNDNEHDEL